MTLLSCGALSHREQLEIPRGCSVPAGIFFRAALDLWLCENLSVIKFLLINLFLCSNLVR